MIIHGKNLNRSASLIAIKGERFLSLKKGLLVGSLSGLVVGLFFGCFIASQRIHDLQSQVENMERNMLPLRSLADARGILVGTAVSATPLRNEALYAETLSREFNILTADNAMKFESIHPAQNLYLFEGADAIVSYAEANNMKVRGHTLVWHNQLPSWISMGSFSREEWINILRDHITTVVSRYQGKIYAWDVVNEAVNDDGSLRDTVWLRNIGPEYLDLAFRWAHEADPNALLFYNDYGGEGLNQKSNAIYDLVNGLLDRGVPINGVGLQMHVSLEYSPSPQEVAENMARLSNLGLDVHITELDVRLELPVTEEKLAAQARIYQELLEVCLNVDNCKAFVMWGFTDRYSWISSFFRGYGSALIFDSSYHAKPAYYALWRCLLNSSFDQETSDGS